jgi:hypothetical protein
MKFVFGVVGSTLAFASYVLIYVAVVVRTLPQGTKFSVNYSSLARSPVVWVVAITGFAVGYYWAHHRTLP